MPFMRDCILDITMPFMRDCILDITMPFLDDIPIKGCEEDTKEETVGEDGCRRFIADHIANCEKILERLEGARITISREKSRFGKSEIVVVGYLSGSYSQKSSLAKVKAISAMKDEC